MWSNGFGNNGDFRNHFNKQNDYPPFGTGLVGGQYFPQLPFQQNMMQFEHGNREGFEKNNFQPEAGFDNEGAFSQNQFVSAASSQFSEPQFKSPTITTPIPRPITTISSRAAELKAQLLRGRERASTATPSVGMAHTATPQTGATEGSSSIRGSPRTPATTTETSEQDFNINDLISQYADPKAAADLEMNDETTSLLNRPQTQPLPTFPEPFAKLQGPTSGSPTKVTKPRNGRMIGSGFHGKKVESRHASSESMSEGEIFEDQAGKKALPPTEPKEAKATVETINEEESAARKPRHEQPLRTSQDRGPRVDFPPRRALPSKPQPQTQRRFEDRRDETDPRQNKRQYLSDYPDDRIPYPPEPERKLHQRRDSHDQNEKDCRTDIKSERHDSKNRSGREARQPTLADILSQDEDLKEWLEITGYHNGAYRDKILNRRRAIAALDAQRNALLAEMEAEERGGIQPIGGIPTPASAMLPPPMLNKPGDRAETSWEPAATALETQADHLSSKKRPHSDTQDPRKESSIKIARTNDRDPRIKQEEIAEHGRPRSSDHGSFRHRSFDDRRDDGDSSRHQGRGRGRGSSRERDLSPVRTAYESRPPTRTRSFDVGDSLGAHERDDWEERDRDRSDRRPFEVRGGYRGRAFDPNYRGRGGRGRGNFQRHELRADSGSFGDRVAHGKPYKDTRGFDRGGKGGQ